MRRIFFSFIFIFLFISIFSANRLSAINEFDIGFTYAHPLVKDKPYGGFTIGGYGGIYEELPVHFGIRMDFSVNLVESDIPSSSSLNSNVRMPLFVGLRISYPVSIITPYIELGPEGSFDFDYVDRPNDLFSKIISIPEFSFNFGGAFGFGLNVHISSFILGGVFRYHVHLDTSRQYFTAGIVIGGEI